MKNWLPIAGIIALLLIPSNALAQRQVLAYDSIARMQASEIGSEFPTPYVVVLVNGQWTEWRWFAGDTTAADGTTILESTSRRGRLGRWRLMTSGSSGTLTGGYSFGAPLTLTGTNVTIDATATPWTNDLGTVRLVTQTNSIDVTSRIITGEFTLTPDTPVAMSFEASIAQDTDPPTAYYFAGEKATAGTTAHAWTMYIYSDIPWTGKDAEFNDTDTSIGLNVEMEPSTDGTLYQGSSISILGLIDGDASKQYGVMGQAHAQVNGQTNIGAGGFGYLKGNTGNVVGGFFGIADNIPFTISSIPKTGLLVDNFDTAAPSLIVRTNQTEVFKVDESGNTIVGGKLSVATNITYTGTTPVIISGGATYGNARGAGSLDVQASHLSTQVASGAGAAAVGMGNTASGAGAMAFGNGNNVSISSGTAFGQVNTVSTGSGAMAFGIGNSATGVNSLALGQSSTASGQSSVAAGTAATSDMAFTWNVTGPIMNWKSEAAKGGSGSGTSGDYRYYSGVQVVLMSKEVDLETTQDYTNSIPTGIHFYPDETGVIVTSANTVGGQPSLSFGIPGNTVKILASTATTGLTAAFKRQRYQTLLTSEGETDLTASVTVGATATTLLGRFYWKGLLVRDQ